MDDFRVASTVSQPSASYVFKSQDICSLLAPVLDPEGPHSHRTKSSARRDRFVHNPDNTYVFSCPNYTVHELDPTL